MQAERADVLISTADQDTTNIKVSMLGKGSEIAAVVSAVHNPERTELFKRIGVNAMENPNASSLSISIEQ